jgi:hypothetical protein
VALVISKIAANAVRRRRAYPTRFIVKAVVVTPPFEDIPFDQQICHSTKIVHARD